MGGPELHTNPLLNASFEAEKPAPQKAVEDNCLAISNIIKLGLPISVDPIHLFPCVSNTYPPRRQGGASPFCGMFSSTSSLSVATTRVLRGDSHVLGLFRSYHPLRKG